jgi:ribosomal protein L29
MKATSATELLRRLSPDEIRERLERLGEEQQALRTLLRAALRMNSGKRASKTASTESEAAQ